MPKYSLVVPAYNEEKALPLFYEAVVPVMESLGRVEWKIPRRSAPLSQGR